MDPAGRTLFELSRAVNSGYGYMIARKSATLVTSLNTNCLVGNISATRKATKSYIIVIGAGWS
jgi:hypothetical protein